MLNDTATAFYSGESTRSGYGGTVPNACTQNGNAAVPVANGQTSTDWIKEIEATRDTKDHTAFARVFGHFGPRVKGYLMRSGTSAEAAEECVQEVMVTLWNKAHLFDPARASVSTWIFTIARNKQIDVVRKTRRPEPEELTWGPQEEPQQDEVITLQQESQKLGDAIAALPDKQRDLVEKAYFGDLTHSEIADETGLPLGTIKSRLRLALDRLRHSMK
jgi:RNA polymerase sigma-70 factor (ECF subfamily)